MKNKVLSFEQKEFLLNCCFLLQKKWDNATTMIYQWDVQEEIKFIHRVISDKEYDSMGDTQRLNHLRNLYGYLTKGVLACNLEEPISRGKTLELKHFGDHYSGLPSPNWYQYTKELNDEESNTNTISDLGTINEEI